MVLPLARDLQDDQIWTKRFDAMLVYCPLSSTDRQRGQLTIPTSCSVKKKKDIGSYAPKYQDAI